MFESSLMTTITKSLKVNLSMACKYMKCFVGLISCPELPAEVNQCQLNSGSQDKVVFKLQH